MAVFDKASLVMIPSQYKEGKIYNIKPEDQSSSFEFERGSAATRVNSSGLIEYVGVGAELITDGGFDDASAWGTSGGANVSGGKLILDAQNEVAQQYNLGIVSGKEYKVDFTIEGENTHLIVYLGSNSSSNADSVYTTQSEGTYSIRLDAHTDGDFIKFNCPASGKNFTVDNVSVRLIENDTPRLDYSGTEPALLLEPQRTNLMINSEYAGGYSTAGTGTVTDNAETSPTNSNNAFVLNDTTSGNYFLISENITLSSADYTLSLFIKKTVGAISNYAGVQLNATRQYIIVDTTNGTYNEASLGVGVDANDNITIEDWNEDWWRVIVTNNFTSGTYRVAIWPAISPDGTSLNVSATGSNIFFGLQLEQGSYATSYIPTNGQTETRLADVCQGGGDASVFNDSEGTLYLELKYPELDYLSGFITISDGTTTDRIVLYMNQQGYKFYIQELGNIITDGSIDVSQYFKVAVKYKSGDNAMFINGSKVGTTNTSTLSSISGLDRIEFQNPDGAEKMKGNIKALHYFPEALTDTELQQLTTI